MKEIILALAVLSVSGDQPPEPLSIQVMNPGMAVRCSDPSGCVIMTVDEFNRIPDYISRDKEMREVVCGKPAI